MQVTPPVAIVDGTTLTACNIPEPDTTQGEAAWVAATNYATDAIVIRTTTHRRYQRIAPGGVDATLPENAPKLWQDIGPTNRAALWDLYRNTQTVSNVALDGVITATIVPGQRVDSIIVAGMDQVRSISMNATRLIDGVVTQVWSWSAMGLGRKTSRWYEYFFEPFRYNKTAQPDPLPPYGDMTINMTFTGTASAPAKVGAVVVGRAVLLGSTALGASNDGLNFSTVTRDAYGTLATLVPRRTVPKTVQSVLVPAASVGQALQARQDLNAVPAAWVGIEGAPGSAYYESLLIIGVYKRFELSHDEIQFSRLQLEIEEI